MASSSAPVAPILSPGSASTLEQRKTAIFDQLKSLCTEEGSGRIINDLNSYLSESGGAEVTEALLIKLQGIAQPSGDKTDVLDNFINAIPGAREYVCETLWYRGFGTWSAKHVHNLDVSQRTRLAYLKYPLIHRANILGFNQQSKALNKLTPTNFDALVKAAYDSINMKEEDKKHSSEAHWTACEEFMHKSFNSNHPLWKFFYVLGATERQVQEYTPPYGNMPWLKQLRGEDWEKFKKFVAKFIEETPDFFKAKLEELEDDKDEKHLPLHTIHPMPKKFMQEFYTEFNIDPVDIFVQYIFAIAGEDKSYWKADVIEFDKNYRDPDLGGLITSILTRKENTPEAAQEELPNIYNVNILGLPGTFGAYDSAQVEPLMRALTGVIRKIKAYGIRKGSESTAITALIEAIDKRRWVLLMSDFDGLGNCIKDELPLPNGFKDTYLVDPQSKGKIALLSEEELKLKPNYVKETTPNLLNPSKPRKPAAEPGSSWGVIHSLVKVALLWVVALICFEVYNYMFRRTSVSSAKAAFPTTLFK